MRLIPMIAIGLSALGAGCVTSGQMRGSTSADAIARLERARAARPNEAAVARSLGIAYYKAGRYSDARAQLNRASLLDPRDGTAALYLGLTAEKQNDIAAARAAYQRYVQHGRTSRVRRQLEARLAALTRQELQLAAKSAVAAEQQLSSRPPSPRVVAVMPLRFVGSDPTLQPLERGLAELIVTDLSMSRQLTVVERARLQALLDEIKLQQAGITDSASNVRAGRMMQAGRIVSGQILQSERRLRVDAAIVNTQTAGVTGGAKSENTLEQLFAIEKSIVLQLFDSLGVRLTTAERNAIEQRPTRSLQAFLAYSRGLSLEDQGRFSEASRSYREAVRLDPSFHQAQQKSIQASNAAQGQQMSTTTVEAALAGTAEGRVAEQAAEGQTGGDRSGAESTASAAADALNSSTAGVATAAAGAGSTVTRTIAPPRDPVAAGSGAEQTTSNALVVVIIRLPKP
jgi:TolB-like protein